MRKIVVLLPVVLPMLLLQLACAFKLAAQAGDTQDLPFMSRVRISEAPSEVCDAFVRNPMGFGYYQVDEVECYYSLPHGVGVHFDHKPRIVRNPRELWFKRLDMLVPVIGPNDHSSPLGRFFRNGERAVYPTNS